MLNDASGLPLGGSTAGSLIVYALFSAFVSGEVILHREAAKAGWQYKCEAIVKAEIQRNAPQPESVPRIKLKSIFGGRDQGGEALRQMFAPLDDLLEQKYQALDRAKELNEQRLEAKAKAAGSRCICASTMLSENRVSLGLYAGSGRLVVPSLFKNLNSELKTALNSPRCAGRD